MKKEEKPKQAKDTKGAIAEVFELASKNQDFEMKKMVSSWGEKIRKPKKK